MKVLVVHNRYQQSGGEDRVVELERALLERRGHTVVPFELDNHAVSSMGLLTLAAKTVWNHGSYGALRDLISRTRPDVVHVHNTLPLASPSVYYAAAAEHVPVVQTLHNYRLLCPNALCLRDGAPCTACVGSSIPLEAIRHRCYRDSAGATAAVAAMLVAHRAAGTWTGKVGAYIAPTRFARRLFVDGGLPADRIVVKPHFVDPVPAVGLGRGGYAIYVGRLSSEKGIQTLLSAWSRLGRAIPLKVVGDGPLAADVAAAVQTMPWIEWLGQREPADVQALVADAGVLILPSLAFETFGQVVVEAFSVGTPVVASDAGAAAELVEPGRTGLVFRAGDPDHLAAQVLRMVGPGHEAAFMRALAREAYETQFTGDANYQMLMAIYEGAVA